MSRDDRVVYGGSCVWWGKPEEAVLIGGTPHCVHCRKETLSMNAGDWTDAMKAYDGANEGYIEFMLWMSDTAEQCYPNFGEAMEAYTEDTGNTIIERIKVPE